MLIVVIIIILLCTSCTNSIGQEYVKKSYENKIVIEQIKINNEIHISSINESINGIIMFSEYGRPDIEGTNTVIGAHSGYGSNAYFNLLSQININEEIIINYNKKEYIYYVDKIYEVDEKDTSPLNKNKYSSLTLISCKMEDVSKRIIVVAHIK